MRFERERRVRFSDCDPAGIAFYPQYFVMHNGFVEQWFDEGLKFPYAALIGERRCGLPTVRLEAEFTAVSRHGDALVLAASVARLGRSSLTLHTEFRAADGRGEQRLRLRQVLVCISLDDHRPRELPADLRQALQACVETSTTGDS
ncbi:MAG: acyl-CoA thioesterase [Burkholderiales bacterium]|nr:acyl-CoA thioesterase [Burkholderiales bacterium]